MQFVHHIPTLIARRARMYKASGKSVAIDLFGCPHEMVDSKHVLQDFIRQTLKKLHMKPHGPTYIDRFGDPDLHLEGYSGMQFVDTASITVHFDEIENRAFIDIFSCQSFDERMIAGFSKDYFQAKEMKFVPLER